MSDPRAQAFWRQLLAALKDSSVGKFAGGAADMLLPEKMSDVLTGPAYAARHPIDSAGLMGRSMQDASQYQFEKMFNAPSTSEAVGHGLAGAIPMLGPAAGMAGEEIGQGNTARGMGMATALLGPSLYRGAKAGTKWTGEAVNEVMAPHRAAAEALANKIQQAREWEAFNKANPNAAANAGKPSPYAPGQGQGSMAQLPGDPTGIGGSPLFDGLDRSTIVNWGDEAAASAAPAPAASALPSRRDALKAGGAAGLGAMLVPKLLEAPKAPVPLVEAAPVLGRGAPSALAREGFYRETKNRAVGYADPHVLTDINQTPAYARVFDPSGKPYSDMSVQTEHGLHLDTLLKDPAGKNAVPNEGGRYFMARVEGQGGDGPGYGKGVFRLNRGENLREAMRTWVQNVKEYDASGDWGGIDPDLPATRSVISEITPEAALRLNTIEKPKVPLYTYGDKYGSGATDHLFKLIDGDGNARAVGAVPNSKKGSMNGRDFAKFEREIMERVSSYTGDATEKGLKLTDTDWDIVPIEQEEFSAIGDFNDTLGNAGNLSYPVSSRPKTVGISPRYNKRVSIRLLKDTMAEQIKENKRAAGLKPPPLLAKAPVLQDNPKLSRFDFLRGTQSETDFMGNPLKKKR